MLSGFSALYGSIWCAMRCEAYGCCGFLFCSLVADWRLNSVSMHIYGALQILQHINLNLHMACGRSRHSTASIGSRLSIRCFMSTLTPVTIFEKWTAISVQSNLHEMQPNTNDIDGRTMHLRPHATNEKKKKQKIQNRNKNWIRMHALYLCAPSSMAAFDRLLPFRLK